MQQHPLSRRQAELDECKRWRDLNYAMSDRTWQYCTSDELEVLLTQYPLTIYR